MPPVFGPVSPSPTRLWSRAAASGSACRPSVRREHRELRALEKLLDHHVLAQLGGAAQPLLDLRLRAADEHAFPGGEPVRLDHARRARVWQLRARSAPPRRRGRPSRSSSTPRSGRRPHSGRMPRHLRGAARPRCLRRADPPARSRRGRSRAPGPARASLPRPLPERDGRSRAPRSRGFRVRHGARRAQRSGSASTPAHARAPPSRRSAPARDRVYETGQRATLRSWRSATRRAWRRRTARRQWRSSGCRAARSSATSSRPRSRSRSGSAERLSP